MKVKLMVGVLLLCSFTACVSHGEQPEIVPKPHTKISQAGIFSRKDIPAERDGIPADQTGAIMFVCAGSEKHEDKEVFISKCPSCGELNYFYWNSNNSEFVCYACTQAIDSAVVKCPECGRPPRLVRIRHQAK
jgi:hypothetical protein